MTLKVTVQRPWLVGGIIGIWVGIGGAGLRQGGSSAVGAILACVVISAILIMILKGRTRELPVEARSSELRLGNGEWRKVSGTMIVNGRLRVQVGRLLPLVILIDGAEPDLQVLAQKLAAK